MKQALIRCMTMALLAPAAWACADLENRSSAAAYLNNGVGARFLAMGSAGVAMVDDVTSTYWNSAGLSHMGIHPVQVGSMYSFLSMDRSFDYLGFAAHTENHGSFGLAVTHYGVEGIEATDNVGNPTGTYADQELSFSLSWAGQLGYQFRYGATARALYHGLDASRAYGYGMDFGALYQPSLASEFTLGMNLQNPAAALFWDTGRREAVMPNLKLGLADKYLNAHLAVAADLDIPFSAELPLTPHLGVELWLMDSVALRAGLNRSDPSVGASLKYEFYEFDYAYILNQRSLGDSHQLSLILLF